MTIMLEHISESALRLLAAEAEKHGASLGSEATEMLLWALIQRKTGNPAEKFRLMRELLLARRGGVPFSDSTEIIRESRDNDH